MTIIQNAADVQTAPQGESELCEVCGHAIVLHDRIAGRFCDATMRGALSRACVCPTSTSTAPTFHYVH